MTASEKARAAVLNVLSNGPGYGLTLQERVKKDHGVRIGSAIYTILRSLEREKLVESYEAGEQLLSAQDLEDRGGRPRIYYRLTDAGIRAARTAGAVPKG